MTALNCPQSELLASFCNGLVDEDESSWVSAHVDECTHCQNSLATLAEQSSDGILNSLRNTSPLRSTPGVSDSYGAEPMCRQIVERVAEWSATLSLSAPAGSEAEGSQAIAVVDVPESVGNYKILRLLGQGGMGTVFQALHVGLDKIVAIKLLTERWARNDAAISRFHREMKAVGKLRHPNIVSAHDAGQANGTHYLVMEFVEGIDLSALTKRQGVLRIPDACELIRQAANGLEHAARRGLVHRDIKPSNLMLTQSDEGQPLVKVLDLGLALLADPAASTASETDRLTDLTDYGQVMGTIDYMAPEQALNSHDVDVRADVYSLGATLCKLLTGEIPYASVKESGVARKLAALAYESVPSITESRPDLPPELASLIDSMLDRERDQRPATPGEVAKRLAPFAAGCQLDALLVTAQSSEICTDDFSLQTLVQAQSAAHPRKTTKSARSAHNSDGSSPGPVPLLSVFRERSVVQFLTIALLAVMLLAGWGLWQSYYIQTADGFVVLEIKDPGVKVTLGEKSFTLDNSGAKYEISPGTHALRIDHAGLTYETDQFKLLKGQTEIFNVWLLHGKIQVTQGDKELPARPLNSSQKNLATLVPQLAKSAGSRNSAVANITNTALNLSDILTSPDWEWTHPEPLGPEVNTHAHEAFPRLSTNGLKLWFQRLDSQTHERVWVCERESLDAPWKAAVPVHETIGHLGPLADLFIARDELTWLFTTWDHPEKPHLKGSTRASLASPWSPAAVITQAGQPSQFPVLSDDGLTLYLMKNFRSIEGDEICVMTRSSTTAPWSEPVRLGPPVNTLGDERPVWISPDQRVLVFHAAGGNRTSTREFDLWLASRSSAQDPWQEPVSFGPVINGAKREASACISADGTELIFDSDRPGSLGSGDLYVSRRIRKVKDHNQDDDTSGPARAIAPFDTRQAKEIQAAWAQHLGVPVNYTNTIGMEFVLIPPGEFLMGSTPADIEAAPQFSGEDHFWPLCARSEGPQHKVILTRPFYLATHEVTQADYLRIMGHNPSIFSSSGGFKDRISGLETSNFPVETIDWNDANTFCNKLSSTEGLQPFKLQSQSGEVRTTTGNGYRLPTEAEWEFACRSGTTTFYWAGNRKEDLHAVGWNGGNSEHRTHAAGGLKPNPFGLYDMHGNVWEWVLDAGDPATSGLYSERTLKNPLASATDTDLRAVRGGFWATPEERCSSARRYFQPLWQKYGHNGFRVVLSIEAVR